MAGYTSEHIKFAQQFLMFLKDAQEDAGKTLIDDINLTLAPAAKLDYETSYALLLQVIDFFSSIANLDNAAKKWIAKHQLPKSKAYTAEKETVKQELTSNINTENNRTAKQSETISKVDSTTEKETAKHQGLTSKINAAKKETVKCQESASASNSGKDVITKPQISTLKINTVKKEIPQGPCTCRKCKTNTAKIEISTLTLYRSTNVPLPFLRKRKVIIHFLRHAHVSPPYPHPPRS